MVYGPKNLINEKVNFQTITNHKIMPVSACFFRPYEFKNTFLFLLRRYDVTIDDTHVNLSRAYTRSHVLYKKIEYDM